MKTILLILAITGVSIITVVTYSCSRSNVNWKVPKSLVGDWSGKQIVSVRYDINHKYVFVKAPDSINLALTIKENSDISGRLGTASFEYCTVKKNRGWLLRKLNMNTDYIITGKLSGAIFPSDTIASKAISFPFNMTNYSIDGSIIMHQGRGIFPLVDVKLVKQ
jgi:hypothetical protein